MTELATAAPSRSLENTASRRQKYEMIDRKRYAQGLLSALLVLGSPALSGHADPATLPWSTSDIGRALEPGSVKADPSGVWTIRAHTGDIGTLPRSLDSFFFVYQPLSTDGSMLALIMGQDGGDPQWGKAGIMLRENTNPGARNLFLGMTTGRGVFLSARPQAGRETFVLGNGGNFGPRRFPTWLRWQREGDRFTPFTSTDGFGWNQIHSPILLPRFNTSALAGLAVSAYAIGPTTAVFSSPVVAPGLLSPIVQVCAGNSAVLLTRPAVSGARGYRVRRGAPNAPGFAADMLTPRPIRETSFADTGLTNGTTVRYLVSALFEQGGQQVEGWPTAVLATPVGTPDDLVGCDIDLEATQNRGSILFDLARGAYRITGSGGGVGSTTDRLFFASRWLTGDFQITTRVLDRPSRRRAKSGLMVRESLEGSARMAFLAEAADVGIMFQHRKAVGGRASSPRSPAIPERRLRFPFAMRLVRRGNTVTAFTSADGRSFQRIGQPQRFQPPLPESLYAGYAITAEDVRTTATSHFADLRIEPLASD